MVVAASSAIHINGHAACICFCRSAAPAEDASKGSFDVEEGIRTIFVDVEDLQGDGFAGRQFAKVEAGGRTAKARVVQTIATR